MAHYLNNCVNRDHKGMFGPDAFYDLDTSGAQATKQFRFRAGDYCVVATQPQAEVVTFTWYRFKESKLASDDARKVQVRVLFGLKEKEESMPKEQAISHKLYRPFFDANGKFKRQSVL